MAGAGEKCFLADGISTIRHHVTRNVMSFCLRLSPSVIALQNRTSAARRIEARGIRLARFGTPAPACDRSHFNFLKTSSGIDEGCCIIAAETAMK